MKTKCILKDLTISNWEILIIFIKMLAMIPYIKANYIQFNEKIKDN